MKAEITISPVAKICEKGKNRLWSALGLPFLTDRKTIEQVSLRFQKQRNKYRKFLFAY